MSKLLAKWLNYNTTEFENNAGELRLKDGGTADSKLAESYVKADGSRAMTGNFDVGNFKITNLGQATDPSDAVTKAQLDNAVSGLNWKEPVIKIVHYVKDTAGAPSGTASNDEVCLNTNENKVYVVSSGAWDSGTSTSDGDRYLFGKDGSDTSGNSGTYTADNNIYEQESSVISGTAPSNNDSVMVEQASLDVGADSGWTYDNDSTSWIQFSGAGQINAGDGLSKTGNTLDVNTGNGLQIDSDAVAIDTTITADLNSTQTFTNKTIAEANNSIRADYTPTNYTTADSNLKSHLAGIDTQLNNVRNNAELHLVTSSDVTNGYFTLSGTPHSASTVTATIIRGVEQLNKAIVGTTGLTPDFEVSGSTFNINDNGSSTGLSGDIGADDVVLVQYD